MEQTREQKLVEYLKRVTGELVEAKERLKAVEAAATEPLAVVGMSCRFPGGGTTPARYWQALLDGVDAMAEVPADRWRAADWYDPDPTASLKAYTQRGGFLDDIASWDAAFFGFPHSEALRIDPQHRMLHELAWEALEDAGIAAETLRGSRTGVFVALSDSRAYMQLENEADGPASINDAFYTIGGSMSAAAGRLAYQLDLRGPVLTVDTACSSALVAVDLAVASLRRGECDQAIVCGASALVHPAMFVQFSKMGMLAPDGRAKVFDKAGNGYTLGEGGGAVVLTRASDAERTGHRVHALIRGSAVNSDGRSNGMTAPNKAAQIAVLRAALADAGLRPDDLDFLESQGTGTSLGDSIEFGALLAVFGERAADHPLLVGAVKSNVGHLLVSAGFAGLIKAVLAVKHGEVPTNLHLETPNPVVTLDGPVRPVRERQELRGAPDAPRRAGVSAFGWSGTNAHVIVEQVPAAAVEAVEAPEWQLLTLSATGDAALRAVAAQLADHLDAAPESSLADVANTVQTGRAALRTRHAVLCRDVPDAIATLRGEITGVETPGGKVAVGLLLPGDTGLASVTDLTEPAFLAALRECGELAGAGPNVVAFAVEYALGTLLRSQVPVAAVFGAGVGAYAADCLAGTRTVADGLALARALDGGATPIPAEPDGVSRIPVAASAEDLAKRVDVVVAPRFGTRAEWLAEVGRLWERGVAVAWPGGRLVDLPTYPFQRTRYWPEPTVAATWSPGDAIVEVAGQRFPRPDIAVPYLAPRTPTESAVAEVWQSFLGVEAIGVDDPFFELGGTSVLGLGVMNKLAKRFEIDLPAASLFERPTVALSAELIDMMLAGASQTSTVDAQAARGARRRAIAQTRNRAS